MAAAPRVQAKFFPPFLLSPSLRVRPSPQRDAVPTPER